MTFAERKALTAAAANGGTPMLWVNGVSDDPTAPAGRNGTPEGGCKARWSSMTRLCEVKGGTRTAGDRRPRRHRLSASLLEEIRLTASAVRAHAEMGARIPGPIWMFTVPREPRLGRCGRLFGAARGERSGGVEGHLPEVTPYNRERFNHLLTNSTRPSITWPAGSTAFPPAWSTSKPAWRTRSTLNCAGSSSRPCHRRITFTEQRQPPRRRRKTGR